MGELCGGRRRLRRCRLNGFRLRRSVSPSATLHRQRAGSSTEHRGVAPLCSTVRTSVRRRTCEISVGTQQPNPALSRLVQRLGAAGRASHSARSATTSSAALRHAQTASARGEGARLEETPLHEIGVKRDRKGMYVEKEQQEKQCSGEEQSSGRLLRRRADGRAWWNLSNSEAVALSYFFFPLMAT